MRPATTLHVLSTVLMAVAFAACALGAWANAQSTDGGGPNIGAGILIGMGTLIGTGGVLCAVGAVIAYLVTRRRRGTV